LPRLSCSFSIETKSALKLPLPNTRAVALDDLEEQRRAVLQRLGEDLQHVARVLAAACGLVDRAARPQRGREDQPDVALGDHVGRAVGQPGLGPGVGQRPEAERGDVTLRGLFGVPAPQLEVVEAQRAGIVGALADGEPGGHRHTTKIPRTKRERGGRPAIIG